MAEHNNKKTAPSIGITESSSTTSSIDNNTEEENNDTKKKVLVAVGSNNPCKVNAVKHAMQRAIGLSSSLDVALVVEGFSVESGVADQPFGDKDTQDGARNRAKNAYTAYKEKHGISPHLAVGLEGGLEWSETVTDENNDSTLWCMAWMAVYGKRSALLVDLMASTDSKYYTPDKQPIFGLSKTGTFMLPSGLAELIEDGMELGHADDRLFGRVDSKKGSGTVGVLTDGLVDRIEYYEHALVLAMTPWIRPDVYGPRPDSSSFVSGLFCSSRK